MKKFSLCSILLAAMAFLAFLVACGKGEVIDITSDSFEGYDDINDPLDMTIGTYIIKCNADPDCRVEPSSSSEPDYDSSSSENNGEESSSSNNTPSSSSTNPNQSSSSNTPSSSSTNPNQSSSSTTPSSSSNTPSSSSSTPSSSSKPSSSSSATPSSSSVVPSSSSSAPSSSSSAPSSSSNGVSSSSSSQGGGGGTPTVITETAADFPVGSYTVNVNAGAVPSFRCYISPAQSSSRTIGTYVLGSGSSTNLEVADWQTQTNAILFAGATTITFNITASGVTCKVSY